MRNRETNDGGLTLTMKLNLLELTIDYIQGIEKGLSSIKHPDIFHGQNDG
jgi:hypothetical protein